MPGDLWTSPSDQTEPFGSVWIRYGQALLDHNLPTLSVLSTTSSPETAATLTIFFDEIIYRAIEGSG